MFEEPLKRAEEAITRMNKTLTLFEKELLTISSNLEDTVSKSRKIFEQEIDVLGRGLQEKLNKFKNGMEDFYSEYKDKLKTLNLDQMEYFSQDAKNKLESFYMVYEVGVRLRVEEALKSDLKVIFEKYGDTLAPFIFKALKQYIIGKIKKLFRIGKSG